MIEDWFDETIGIATRFVYYEFRVCAAKQIDPSVLSPFVMQLAHRRSALTLPRPNRLPLRLSAALNQLHRRWPDGAYLVGDSLSVADIAVAALLSP